MKPILAALFLLCIGCTPSAPPTPAYSGPVIDAHAHIRFGDNDAARPDQPIGPDALRKLDEEAGVATSALIVMARKGQIADTRARNDQIIKIAAESGGHFYPVASVHPLDGADALAELDRLAGLKVRVIKLHPNTQNFDVADPAVGVVAEHAGELGLVLLFDSYKPWDPAEMGKFLLLAVEHPKAKLVLAHMGFSQFRETMVFAEMKKLQLAQNVWFDLSAIASAFADFPVEDELVWTMRQIGMDKFLFGSDWPVDTPATAKDAVLRLGLTPQEQRQVFHDNASALLGLP